MMRSIKAAIALGALTLTAGVGDGCAHRIDPGLNLAAVPQYYVDCFYQVTKLPKGKALTRGEIVAAMAELRRSELRLSQCGKDLIRFYNAQRAVAAGKGKR